MPKRTKQHQLEDSSRYKFGMVMPPEWVFRDKDKDYGIDGEVEIFDPKERATGLVFWVQLKATSSRQTRTIKGIDLSLETISYYKSLDIPVMIARYSEYEEKFYIRWASGIDTFHAKNDAKTMRVSFTDSDAFDESSPEEIYKYLSKLRAVKTGSLSLPIHLNLSFSSSFVCGISSVILLSKIRTELSKFGHVLQLSSDKDRLIAEADISSDKLEFGILDIAGCTLHSVDLMDTSDLAENLAKDILLALSLCLSRIGYSDLASRLVVTNGLLERLKVKEELLSHLLPSLLRSDYVEETLKIVSDVCDSANSNFLETITNILLLSLRHSEDKSKQLFIETFLIKCIDRYKESSPNEYGVSQYNLGNFYRSVGKFRHGARSMLLARRFEPLYYKQEYFFRELAGALFEIDKYKFASRNYRKAIDLGADHNTRALYADSLLFSGRYQEASDEFSNYFKQPESHHFIWCLKAYFLSALIKEHGITCQNRDIKKAIQLADVSNLSSSQAEINLEKALDCDLLCGLAWFNLANLYYGSAKIEGAAFCYTMAALVQTWDIESWVNATACSFSTSVPVNIFAHIIRAGYFFNGENYINALYQMIENSGDPEKLGLIAEVIEELLREDRRPKEKTPEVRLLNKSGKFENILNSDLGTD